MSLTVSNWELEQHRHSTPIFGDGTKLKTVPRTSVSKINDDKVNLTGSTGSTHRGSGLKKDYLVFPLFFESNHSIHMAASDKFPYLDL